MMNISFSWDDGSPEDLKMLELCLRHHIPSMFFVPAKNPEREVLSGEKIRLLANNNFEIGSHTYSHQYLTSVNPDLAVKEMRSGRDYLEQILGKQVSHFCFPGGKYNQDLISEAKKIFGTARTADTCALPDPSSFLIKPTFHFFSRGKRSLLVNSFMNSNKVFRSILRNIFSPDYFDVLKASVDDLAKISNCRIIVWGHSWEIEEFGLWKNLEDFFKFLNDYYPGCVLNYSDLLYIRRSDNAD